MSEEGGGLTMVVNGWKLEDTEQKFTRAEIGGILDQFVEAMMNNRVAVLSEDVVKRLPCTIDAWFHDYFHAEVRKAYPRDGDVREALWNCCIVTHHDMSGKNHKIAFKAYDQQKVSEMREVRIAYRPPGFRMGVCHGWFNNGLH